jgi:hypothetical protein
MLGAGGREEARVATTEHDDLEVASRVEPPDGDDITVIPEPADAPKRSRRRVVLLSALAVVLIAAPPTTRARKFKRRVPHPR